MFICKKHPPRRISGWHSVEKQRISRGKCELCDEVADCIDCKCYKHEDADLRPNPEFVEPLDTKGAIR